MFSEELEMLIDAAIADGEVSEKERAILHKRAQAEGVDTDELDMIVDARIAKAKKAQESSQNERDEDEKYDPDEVKTALEHFSKRLQEIENKQYTDIKGSFWKGIDPVTADEQRQKAILNHISTFAIPSAKKDLIDFIIFLKPYRKANSFSKDSSEIVERNKAFRKRYEECVDKANSLFPNDEDIDLAINGPKKEKKGFFGFGKKS